MRYTTMGPMNGVLWLLGILSMICSDLSFAQTKRSSRLTSSRTFGLNVKSSSSSGIEFDCPEEFGYYPHPSDCTQYYVCVFGGALLESCTGGLMYSHELQTCDWPRNVGCEITEVGSLSSSQSQSSSRDISPRVPQAKQQVQQHVPSRVRFSSLSTGVGQQLTSKQSSQLHQQQQPQQHHRQHHHQQQQQQHQQQQISPVQIQTIPPPPELRIAPNPIITSRGQPKPLLDAHEDIAKLYAEAHETLPPAEEEESDRQQRVYRGQPSTVGQVQRDRDGIIHQANVNALPNHGKVGSYAYGSQSNQFRVETSSQAPANIFIQQRQKPVAEQSTRNYYNTSNHQSYDPYDSYYSVYDDDIDLYRDVEYNQQQQRGKTQQQSTFRPEIITTPSPSQVPVRETYVNKPQLQQIQKQQQQQQQPPQQQQQQPQQQQQGHQQYNQPSLVYNTDYEDALIAQIENDEEYSQPQRNQPIRGDRIEINSITDQPIVISSTLRTSDQPKYTPTTYAPISQSPTIQQQQQPQQQSSSQNKLLNSPPIPIPTRPMDQYSIVSTQPTANPTQSKQIPTTRTNTNTRTRGGSHYTNNDREQPATATSNRGTHPPRSRPTLKPSGTIVSKASEYIDIYKNPPSRPEPLYPQPTPDKTAAKCRKDVCLLPDCYCGGKDIPGEPPVETVPQIVLLTFDDSVNDLNKQLYTDLFEKGRVNPNGCPISATFYVSHEWTDYSQVQNLYSDGHEIASHTVSHSFGEQFSQKKWTREVAGQREILSAYGGVKLSDVRGMRAPFLSIGGNKMFKMLYDSNFTYDSSMPVYENRPPSWPYTLDYKIFHDCMIPPCPTKSYPGVWEVPMVMWQDLNGGRCSMGDACSNPGESDGVLKMLMKNFERHYMTNRAPFGLFYHAAWFTQPHHKEGFIKFLDTINAMNDVWIVTNWQALQWVRDPTPISRINQFQPFQCDYSDRPKRCNNPKVCNLWHKSGVRYMRTCQPCPDIYPWTGKTGIRSSRVDNDIEE